MKREISSPATSFYKLCGPVFALTIVVGYTLSYFTGVLDRPDGTRGLEWAILFCVVLALAATWGALKIKRVSLDDQFLYVSNGGREIRIPLSHVADVNAFGSPYKTIIVTLRKPSKFGRKIVFVPQDRTARDTSTGVHPTVLELKEAIDAAGGAGRGCA